MTFAQLLIASRRPRRLLALVTLLPIAAEAQAQTIPVPPATVAPASGAGSPVAYARQAQAEFERARREGLGFSSGGATSEPDVQFGTIFYWNNNNDVPPRPEVPEIGVARRRLLESLREAALAAPADDWVAGQRVK